MSAAKHTKFFAVHLSKTGLPGGRPKCGRGTSVTSGISVGPERFANDEDRCGHCAKTNLGKKAIERAAITKAGGAA